MHVFASKNTLKTPVFAGFESRNGKIGALCYTVLRHPELSKGCQGLSNILTK